jgi:hypothetical protein
MSQIRLEREVRFLKIYAAVSTLLFLSLFLSAFSSAPRKQKLAELDVERINVVQPDGKLALVLANRDRLPGAILNGKEVKSNREGAAGLLFYNGKGDEAGGLVYGSEEKKDGGYNAVEHLSFDQYNNDQVAVLEYTDDGKIRSTGLTFRDRPLKPDSADMIAEMEALNRATGEEKTKLEQKIMAAEKRGEYGAQRVFVGSYDRKAAVALQDTLGRTRLRLSVDASNVARLEFLDEAGKAVYTLPPK